MGTEHRHTHTGAGDAQIVETENLFTFVQHFHLLLGVAVLKEGIDMRQQVERDLVRIHILDQWLVLGPRAGLLIELDQTAGAAA